MNTEIVTWVGLLAGVSLTLAIASVLALTALLVQVRRLEAVRQRWEAAVARWERTTFAPDSGRETDRAVMDLLLALLRAVLQPADTPSGEAGPRAMGSGRKQGDGPH